MEGDVAVVTLNRPEKKNPLTFESYAELRDTFRALTGSEDVKAVVLTGAGENFCSGGDVLEIIAPLTARDMKGLLAFTRMTGDVIKAIRACPQPVIAAIDGVCVGAGACLALASDLRIGTPEARGLRHGRVRAAAAHHRPGARRRAAVHRPLDERRGGPAVGLLQPPVPARAAAR
jgi:enoyl-CoA hydratase/carnithine racemase